MVFYQRGELTQDGERLYQVFNRDFSNAFLRGDLNQSMFIDNPPVITQPNMR